MEKRKFWIIMAYGRMGEKTMCIICDAPEAMTYREVEQWARSVYANVMSVNEITSAVTL